MLTRRFTDAVEYAAAVHGAQFRKGGETPYVAHLLSAAALVLEAGGDEDTAIGALLHDAAEDQGGHARVADIRRRFGDAVADLVEACTDAFERPKPDWHERKKRYIERIPDMTPGALLVTWADKLHNARSMVADQRRLGDALWERFTASGPDMAWYLRSVADALAEAGLDPGLVDALDREVAAVEAAVGVRRSPDQAESALQPSVPPSREGRDTVVLGVGRAYADFMRFGVATTRAGRVSRPVQRVGFYVEREIRPEVPRIRRRFPGVKVDAEALARHAESPDPEERLMARAVSALRREEPDAAGELVDAYVLTPRSELRPDETLPHGVMHRGVEPWVREQRYVDVETLRTARTTDDLSG